MSDNRQAGRAIGIDHCGFVVTDLDRAVAFFIDELGFADLNRRAVMRDDAGDEMTARYDVPERAVGRYVFLGAGRDKIELLEWTAPDQNTGLPKNSDLGGRHVAIAVDDLDAVAARIAKLEGFSVREKNERGFCYIGTPFGLEVQLIPAAS